MSTDVATRAMQMAPTTVMMASLAGMERFLKKLRMIGISTFDSAG